MKKLLYIEISEKIMTDIVCGKLKPGDKVMSVRNMALELKVNPKTIQRAFDYLDEKQIFVSQQGEGRFITKKAEVIDEVKKQVFNNELVEFIDKIKRYNFNKEEVINKINKEYKK